MCVYIEEDRSLDEDKELKVKIPVRQHLRLHSLKVLTGTNISDTVAAALEAYFEGSTVLPTMEPEGLAEDSAEQAVTEP